MSPETQLHPSWPCPEGCSWEPASPSLQGKVWEEVAFQQRAVHPGKLLLPAVGHSTPPPPGKALAPEQAGRPVSSSTQCPPLSVIRGSGPQCAGSPPSPPCASTSSLLRPCPWSGGTSPASALGLAVAHYGSTAGSIWDAARRTSSPAASAPLCLAFSWGFLTPPTPQPYTCAAFLTRSPTPISAPRAVNRTMAARTF